MNFVSRSIFSLCLLFGMAACDQQADTAGLDDKLSLNLLEITAYGMRFQGPQTTPSGWTTIRLNNQDGMLHFAMLVKLPEGVTAQRYSSELGAVFQDGYDLMVEGKDEEVAKVFGSVPAWVGDLIYFGGPGFTSGKKSSSASMFLAPGNYVLECYIKSNGKFHSYSPDENTLAMVLPLTVIDAPGGMAEPNANVTLSVNDAGFELTAGELQAGENSIRINFDTQIRFPSFVGQDVHIMRIDTSTDLAAAINWMDWQLPSGLQIPSPVTFIGGVNDMPMGTRAYVSANLTAGKYAFIGEAPEADKKGLLLEFEIE